MAQWKRGVLLYAANLKAAYNDADRATPRDQRPLRGRTKARKDVRQATQLLEVLLEDRPEEIRAAWDALQRRPRDRSVVRKALERAGSGEVLSRTLALVRPSR